MTEESAATLFWLGFARLGRISLFQDETALLGELYLPVELLERSRAQPRSLPLLGDRGPHRLPRSLTRGKWT